MARGEGHGAWGRILFPAPSATRVQQAVSGFSGEWADGLTAKRLRGSFGFAQNIDQLFGEFFLLPALEALDVRKIGYPAGTLYGDGTH